MVLLVAGCGGGSAATTKVTVTVTTPPTRTTAPPGPKVFTITGHIDTYPTGGRSRTGTRCDAENGMEDISPGASVVVTSPNGVKVGVGALESGRYHPIYTCRFAFTVADVPDKYPLYSIEVGNRGEVTFPRAKLDAPIALSLQN